jgi:sugar lactone lactonase YvrE
MALGDNLGRFSAGLLGALGLSTVAGAQVVDFVPERWDLRGAQVVEHLGRQALTGTALLKDARFEDGVIEVDVAMKSGARSYPGVLFRAESESDYERIYLRPHRAPLYSDAVQYVASFNGVDSWQLYNGPGWSAQAVVPTDRWVHVKVEVRGTQARVFLDNAAEPALTVWELQRGRKPGGLGLNAGPSEGPPAAYFSNFSWRADAGLNLGPAPEPYSPPGFLRQWEISRPIKRRQLDFDSYPDAARLGMSPWTPVVAQPGGVVDISRTYGRSGFEPDGILARTVIRSDKDESRKYWIGYSDEAAVFLNGRLVFYGNSAYRSRDLSFLGILGLFDAVSLPLRKGDNELLFVVGEAMGGWGLTVRDASAVLEAPGVKRLWASEATLQIPESAVWDPVRKAIYVSNYDGYNRSAGAGRQHLSKLTPDGKLAAPQWVSGLNNPTGLALRGDRLYAVEPRQIVEIDIPQAKVLGRFPAPGALALNDVAIADNGDVYVSDSRKSAIFKFANGTVEEWLSSPEIANPNGVHVHQGKLIVAVNGDRRLKAVDLASKQVTTIATLHRGLIDGVKTDRHGNYLVSYNDGQLLRVSPEGRVTTLIDLTGPETNVADFDYLPEEGRVIFPTFLDNRVMAYSIE